MSLFETLSQSGQPRTGIMNGVWIGIVTNNEDPECLGRVKLHLPMRSNDDETYWARIATTMAGNNMGTYFIPEVGSEVLVAFESGDPEHPIVIGALWNGEDKPPESNNDGKNNIKKIQSRSGHTILFNDDNESGSEQVVISSGGGHSIILDDSSGGEKISIVDSSGSNKLIIDSSQNSISLECSMQLKIKANEIDIEGTSSLSMKSNGMLTIQGKLVKIN